LEGWGCRLPRGSLFYLEHDMAATQEERNEMFGIPTCACGTRMQLISMDPDEDGVTENWRFQCANCGNSQAIPRRWE
jgi:hypothetical protein